MLKTRILFDSKKPSSDIRNIILANQIRFREFESKIQKTVRKVPKFEKDHKDYNLNWKGKETANMTKSRKTGKKANDVSKKKGKRATGLTRNKKIIFLEIKNASYWSKGEGIVCRYSRDTVPGCLATVAEVRRNPETDTNIGAKKYAVYKNFQIIVDEECYNNRKKLYEEVVNMKFRKSTKTRYCNVDGITEVVTCRGFMAEIDFRLEADGRIQKNLIANIEMAKNVRGKICNNFEWAMPMLKAVRSKGICYDVKAKDDLQFQEEKKMEMLKKKGAGYVSISNEGMSELGEELNLTDIFNEKFTSINVRVNKI